MIQIEDIHIQELRGIRDLRLRFGGKSFVVWGPNGSGKSGVVDAIDFAFTGSMSRLAGAGSAGLSLSRHGPHVHRRDDPGAAQVSVTVRDTVSGKTAKLTRNIRNAKQYTLEPEVPEVRSALDKAQQHPELTLSRREIIKYILAEAGKRSQEVQALLKLDRLGEIRSILRTVQTQTSSAETAAQGQVAEAEASLRRHLDLSTLLLSEVVAAINRRRRVLELELLEELSQTTILSRGVDAIAPQGAFNKASAMRDVTAVVNRIADPAAFLAAAKSLSEALDQLETSPGIFSTLQQRDLVTAGLALVTDAQCPLCDLEWADTETLRMHLVDKRARSEEAAKLQERIQQGARAVIRQSEAVRGLIATAERVVASDGTDGLLKHLRGWTEDLIVFETRLRSAEGAASERSRLADDPLSLPAAISPGLTELLTILDAKPDQSATADARTFLTIAQERWDALRLARGFLEKKAAAHAAARVIYRAYCSVTDATLTTLYQTVQDEFSAYYREINTDDESAFKARLQPSSGKLELSVDFYGLGMFPPTAYHSEGHQDGMGICLYLALIKQLLGTDFRFAVLDDVVMSVDSNHRKRFCHLLKTRFPDVQFIITTHDEVWARQMQSSGLVTKAAQARFHGWTVDTGPAYEEASDFWDKIAANLGKNDVPTAAATLRRNLERIMADLAEELRGSVVYRAAGNYDLGELLGTVKGRHGKLLRLAAKSADTWKDEVAKARVRALQAARASAVRVQESENWAINPAIHFNGWASFSKADFEPVVEGWRQFLDLFECDNIACESRIYVLGNSGNEETLRCRCGTFNLNLRGN